MADPMTFYSVCITFRNGCGFFFNIKLEKRFREIDFQYFLLPILVVINSAAFCIMATIVYIGFAKLSLDSWIIFEYNLQSCIQLLVSYTGLFWYLLNIFHWGKKNQQYPNSSNKGSKCKLHSEKLS